jgi:hypothetical protein
MRAAPIRHHSRRFATSCGVASALPKTISLPNVVGSRPASQGALDLLPAIDHAIAHSAGEDESVPEARAAPVGGLDEAAETCAPDAAYGLGVTAKLGLGVNSTDSFAGSPAW